jgi:sugar transferase EpsL
VEYQRYIKRIVDVILAAIILLILLPYLLFIAIIVRYFLGTPVLFKQERAGLCGKPFIIYKFRTMKDVFDANGKLLSDKYRLTWFGKLLRKFSLDEFPQLLNVIKGDMSLVGPRPLLMEYLPRYTAEQVRRHDVLPGITGWAQINGRNALQWEEKFKLDVWYVDNCSFWLDIKILWLTMFKVVRCDGICQPGQATVEKFTGNK